MEATLSPAALDNVERAIHQWLEAESLKPHIRIELQNVANDIRSLLQHYVVERKAAAAKPIDPLLE
jgi:molecular chaperone GrpE (heat shock protein)